MRHGRRRLERGVGGCFQLLLKLETGLEFVGSCLVKGLEFAPE
jgi:hypothetical protein